jgi:hypothetical protein
VAFVGSSQILKVTFKFGVLLLFQIRFEITDICNFPETFGRVVGSNRNSLILEWVMIGVLISILLPIALAAMLCYLNFDPFWFVLPETKNHSISIVLWLLRFLGFSTAAYMGWSVFATIDMVTIIGFKIVKETLSSQNRWTSRIRNGTSMQNVVECYLAYLGSRKQSGNRTVPLTTMYRILAIQRQVRILMLEFNEAFYFLFPVIFLTGEWILVVCNYATIGMHETIPMPFYLVMPGVSVFVVMIIMFLFPTASDIYESSSEFLRAVRLIAGRNKYWRKIWRAEKPVKLSIGGICFAKRSTKTTYLVHCVDSTVDALLLR